MKKFLVISIVVLFSLKGEAQTDPLYTQYRVNMMSVNPAYAGSRNALTVGYLYRNQWVGLEGAPTTQTILAHSPINNNLGFGASVTHDVIGPTKQTAIYANTSGRIKMGSTYLAAGIQFGLDYFKTEIFKSVDNLNRKQEKYLKRFGQNLNTGIDYYHQVFESATDTFNDTKTTILNDLKKGKTVLKSFIAAVETLTAK